MRRQFQSWVSATSILFALLISLEGRTFTSSDGKTLEAEYLFATDTDVTIKLKRNGKQYTIALERLSKSDQDYVAELRETAAKEEADKAAAEAQVAAAIAAAQTFVQFSEENLGKKVGNGECWTLADHAFKTAKVKPPRGQGRIWGRKVDWEEEDVLPGDILELESAKFSNGSKTGPNHTAIVKESKKEGELVVYHQNWGKAGKKVAIYRFDLNQMTSGKAFVWRYQ